MKVDLSELPKNILNDALLKLKTLLQAESASLFLLDREHQELVLNAVLDEHKAQFQGLRQPVTDGVAGSVAMRRQAVLVKDINKDPRFSTRQFRHYHTNSFICVPLGDQDGLFGIINISDKITGEPFSEDDFHLACLIAQLTSRLVENEVRFAAARVEIDALKKEKALIKEERVFLEKFASMGKLAGGIVHEINNPLDGVMRYTNLLIEKDPDRTVAHEYLNEIKLGLARMKKITRSLLEFSQQIKDGRYEDRVDVNEVIEEALSLFRHTLFLGHIVIEKNFRDMLPKVKDKGLCRVFSNIIKNAFDAMPEGGTLTICTRLEHEHLIIAFRDTGHGIPDELREKIFTPFFTTKAIGKGIGLGLPICFEVVQRYNGKIEVDSTPDVGTEFRVRLPLSTALI